jgi:hypothetical protein
MAATIGLSGGSEAHPLTVVIQSTAATTTRAPRQEFLGKLFIEFQ